MTPRDRYSTVTRQMRLVRIRFRKLWRDVLLELEDLLPLLARMFPRK